MQLKLNFKMVIKKLTLNVKLFFLTTVRPSYRLYYIILFHLKTYRIIYKVFVILKTK